MFELTLLRPAPDARPPEPLEPTLDDPAPATNSMSVPEREEVARRPARAPVQGAPAASAPTGLEGPARPPSPPAPSPAQRAPASPPPPPGLGQALRAAACADGDRLSARERALCDERLGRTARGAAPLAPTRRARDLAYDIDQARNPTRNAYNALRADGMHCEMIEGCLPPARNGVPFGKPPPALPVIPPSTLRGDDDALRPRARPQP